MHLDNAIDSLRNAELSIRFVAVVGVALSDRRQMKFILVDNQEQMRFGGPNCRAETKPGSRDVLNK